MDKLLGDVVIVCPVCNTEAGWWLDEKSGLKHLKWSCEKCGTPIIKWGN